MATNLNPGADATLVQAATNAAMANVPLDQSKAYAQLAAGYAKFADGMVSMYAPIAKQVGEAAAPLVEKVKEKVGENLQELWLAINTPFKDEWTVQPNEKGEQITNLVEEWEASAGEGNLLESFSIGNYNSADIEKFQTRIEELYPNAFPKWGTDGRMGLETETAIKNLLKDKEEYGKSGPTILPGKTFSFDNGQGQTNNISLTGQDEYIQGLKDENASIEAEYASNIIDKTERDKKLAINKSKAQNAKNSARAFSKEQVRVMNLINNNNFNPMASGAMGMDFINAAIERGRSAADGSRVVRGYDDDGNIALIWIDKYGRAKIDPTTGKSWVVSQGQMKKFIVEKDTESELAITKIVTTDQQALGKSGVEFNGQEIMNNATKLISDGGEKTFLHLTNTPLADNTGTYREYVYGAKKDENGNWVFDPTKLSQEIYTQLTMLGSQFDADGNDRVDAQDFNTPESRAALANYLTSYNPTSVNAFASFMKDTAEGYHAQGAGMIKPAKTKKKTKKKTDENKEPEFDETRDGGDNTETINVDNNSVEELMKKYSGQMTLEESKKTSIVNELIKYDSNPNRSFKGEFTTSDNKNAFNIYGYSPAQAKLAIKDIDKHLGSGREYTFQKFFEDHFDYVGATRPLGMMGGTEDWIDARAAWKQIKLAYSNNPLLKDVDKLDLTGQTGGGEDSGRYTTNSAIQAFLKSNAIGGYTAPTTIYK